MTETSVVQLVTQDLERGLEVLARYPADAPEAATLWEELRRALHATWATLPYLVLAIDADGICWDGQRVTVVHQARLLTPEDEDDLGTLLWEQGVPGSNPGAPTR